MWTVHIALTRRSHPRHPEVPISKNINLIVFKFGLYIFLQHPKISSTTHFCDEWISPSTVLRKFWTHPKFCATPWYIESLSSDIFSIVWLTSYGDFRRETIPNTRFQGWALLGYILSEQYIFRTMYVLKTYFLRIHILKSPDSMKT